jgi:lipid A 3-O-deacylase
MLVGFGTHALGSKQRHDLTLASLRFGRMLGWKGDLDRWRHGHCELIGELWGGVQRNSPSRTLAGLTPFIRYNFAAAGRWVPFVDFGAGAAYTNIHGHDLSEGWQFNLQGGLGAHYRLREQLALTFQYRWFHLSNAGLNVPNSGLNSQVVFVGLSHFH